MKFNFNLKTIVFVLLIILFSVIFLYNMMPSYMEGFKEGNTIPVDASGNPLVCETDPSGNNMIKADGTLHETYTHNDLVYKCDNKNNLVEHKEEEKEGEDDTE